MQFVLQIVSSQFNRSCFTGLLGPYHVPIPDHYVCVCVCVCVQFLSLPFQPHLLYFLPLEDQTFLQEKLSPEQRIAVESKIWIPDALLGTGILWLLGMLSCQNEEMHACVYLLMYIHRAINITMSNHLYHIKQNTNLY